MRHRRSNLSIWLKASGGILIAAAIGAAAIYAQPPPRDDESLCLKSREGAGLAITEAAHHILVIDKTDKWNAAQTARVRNLVLGMRDQLGVNERFSIFMFSDSVPLGFPPAFSLCNPGRGSDTNFVTSNPRKWEKKFVAKFGRPLDDILVDLTSATEGPHSPILEILIDITNRSELTNSDIPRRLVLVSDMLQNSAAHTLFPKRIPIPQPSPRPPQGAPMGGPFVPMPLGPSGTNKPIPTPPAALPKFRLQEPRKLTAKEAESLVERMGGLRNLNRFRIEVYQIRGKYSDDKLATAKQFWDLLTTQYGAKIDWKVL